MCACFVCFLWVCMLCLNMCMCLCEYLCGYVLWMCVCEYMRCVDVYKIVHVYVDI